MPAPSHPSRGRFRRILPLAALVALGLAALGFLAAGRLLAREDPLTKADAIFVLAGSRMERPLEGGDLYREGWAPRLVMTHQAMDSGIQALAARGVTMPRDETLARDVLVQIGVPPDATLLPDKTHDNTAQEAQTLRALAAAQQWRTVIVVTSKFHLTRAGFAMRRELEGSGVEVVMRGSRYDPADPPRWWATRRDIRWMLSEAPKLIAYVLGLGA